MLRAAVNRLTPTGKHGFLPQEIIPQKHVTLQTLLSHKLLLLLLFIYLFIYLFLGHSAFLYHFKLCLAPSSLYWKKRKDKRTMSTKVNSL